VTSSRRGPGNNVYVYTYTYDIITNLPIAVAVQGAELRQYYYYYCFYYIIMCIYTSTAVMAAVCPGSWKTYAYLRRDFFNRNCCDEDEIGYRIVIIIIIIRRRSYIFLMLAHLFPLFFWLILRFFKTILFYYYYYYFNSFFVISRIADIGVLVTQHDPSQ